MTSKLTANEKIIINILREDGCVSLETAMSPETLLSKCAAEGLTDAKKIEQTTVNLVDKDYIEYEMDENLETSHLWLIYELRH